MYYDCNRIAPETKEFIKDFLGLETAQKKLSEAASVFHLRPELKKFQIEDDYRRPKVSDILHQACEELRKALGEHPLTLFLKVHFEEEKKKKELEEAAKADPNTAADPDNLD